MNAPPPPFHLESPALSYAGYSQVEAYFWQNTPPQLIWSFSVWNGKSSVGMSAYLPVDTITSRAATVAVTNGPIDTGLANVTIDGAPGALDMATVALTFGPGRVSGEIIPAGGKERWTVSGKLSVGCSVPSSLLGSNPQQSGGIVEGSSETVVPDQALQTSPCQQLRAFAGP